MAQTTPSKRTYGILWFLLGVAFTVILLIVLVIVLVSSLLSKKDVEIQEGTIMKVRVGGELSEKPHLGFLAEMSGVEGNSLWEMRRALDLAQRDSRIIGVKLVIEPLDRLGLKLTQIDKYATEMHNPEVTEPQGSGNVPRTNYRTIASFAVLRDEIAREDIARFVEVHGMPGFSPTQGHIPSAVPVLGHSLRKMTEGDKMRNTMFLAKGSLFLGRMTQLADGISFILERNEGGN